MTLRVTAHGMATFLLYTVVYIHIRKVLELPNSPQDPIIIDLGKKRGGNIIINYFWRALLTPLVPGNVQKKSY